MSSLAIVNGSTVTEFVSDNAEFESFVKEWFQMIDENGEGKLSGEKIRGRFGPILHCSSTQSEAQQEIFKRFDEDKNGALDLKEFKSLMTELMNVVASGIGDSPVLVALGKDSLLMKAVQREVAAHSSS